MSVVVQTIYERCLLPVSWTYASCLKRSCVLWPIFCQSPACPTPSSSYYCSLCAFDFFLSHVEKAVCVFLYLACFIKHDMLYVHPSWSKWQDLLFFLRVCDGRVCVCRIFVIWAPRLSACLSYCDSCYDQHGKATFLGLENFLFIGFDISREITGSLW